MELRTEKLRLKLELDATQKETVRKWCREYHETCEYVLRNAGDKREAMRILHARKCKTLWDNAVGVSPSYKVLACALDDMIDGTYDPEVTNISVEAALTKSGIVVKGLGVVGENTMSKTSGWVRTTATIEKTGKEYIMCVVRHSLTGTPV